MAKATVYYDYHEGVKVPIWMVIYFGAYNLDWNRDTIYIPIQAPFQLHGAEDFQDEMMSFSVTFDDLVINPDKPGYFGIYLPRVRTRAEEDGVEVDEIEQFILQVGDIEETLQMKIFSDRFLD